MIKYKIYPMPGICEKTITGSVGEGETQTLGELLNAITKQDEVNLLTDAPFLALLNGKILDLSENTDISIADGSELVIMPAIMGG